MHDGDLLLRRILETPEDDTVRLAYADWLDEQPAPSEPCGGCSARGYLRAEAWSATVDPKATLICPRCDGAGVIPDLRSRNRAAFIREQINRAIHERSDGYSRTPRQCEIDLLSADELTFARPCGEIGWQANSTWVPECDYEFTRGFVSRVTLSLAHFMEHAEAVFRAQPVTEVVLGDRAPREVAYQSPSIWAWDVDARDRECSSVLPITIWAYGGHNSRGESLAWLSARCVAYGRTLAGLAPLPK